jgi:drug/metabolite transporter (DMT)-like permease
MAKLIPNDLVPERNILPSNSLPKSQSGFLHSLTSNAYVMLSLTTVLWAMNAVMARLVVDNVSPMLLVMLRWLIACSVLAVIARGAIKADWPVLRQRLPYIAIMGAFGYTAFNALFYAAGHHTTALNIAILQGSMPVLVLLAGVLVLREMASPIQWIGTALTLLGVAAVASGGDIARLKNFTFNIGDIWLLIACILYSAYTIGLRKRPAVSGLSFFAIMAVAATVSSIPLAYAEYVQGQMLWPTTKGWWLILFIGLGPSLIAQLMFMRGVELIGPLRSGIFINLVPVFGAILAIFILGESFGWHHGVALLLVLGGIAIAERGRKNNVTAPARDTAH